STERRIMFSPEISRQVGEARAEWKILREIAAATYPERAQLLGCETGWKMREEIARVVPFYDGVQNLRAIGDAIQYGGPHLCADFKFATPDGKAHFRAVPLPKNGMHENEVSDGAVGTRLRQKRFGGQAPRPTDNGHSNGSTLFKISTRRGKQFNSL